MNPGGAQLQARELRKRVGFSDLALLFLILGGMWGALHLGRQMWVRLDANALATIDMSLARIPAYAGRTLLRMWVAFGCSLFFTVVVGYAAAKSARARALILPTLDVLQSVPVLGFLSVTVAGFMALFPGNVLGVECASIFAIFTGQVWNMAFGFYHSLRSIPTDLGEVALSYGLNRWQRFVTAELPAAIHSLLWNSMLSFGGGWFFVAQSEAISVMNKDIRLPGLGSYMAGAIERSDSHAALCAVVAMFLVIFLSDQLVWRPLLVWADKFKLELTESSERPTSWFYNVVKASLLLRLARQTASRLRESFTCWMPPFRRDAVGALGVGRGGFLIMCRAVSYLLVLWLGVWLLRATVDAALEVHARVSLRELGGIVRMGGLTMLRVFAVTLLATLVWTPIGVWIGARPAVARVAQPLVQMAASFPVNMTFPFVVGLFVACRVDMNWGSILLIALGTQWYILFNVIAGSMAISNDLREAAAAFGLRRWALWRTLILPAIFPFWVTGACTAAGGAWNASVVAEMASWGRTTLRAEGLGAFIADVTRQGNRPLILCGIGVMAFAVVLMNKLLWRPLYALAERRCRMD
jgi:NitT/TauT family transport system permease protein